MITTATAPFVLEASSEQTFDGSSIQCEPTFIESSGWFSVRLFVLSSGDNSVIYNSRLLITVAEVDAETGTGSSDTEIWFNALEKAVVTKLGGVSGNGSVAFSVV